MGLCLWTGSLWQSLWRREAWSIAWRTLGWLCVRRLHVGLDHRLQRGQLLLELEDVARLQGELLQFAWCGTA